MNYPTLEEVEAADILQLASWYRFLPSPGLGAVGQSDFESTMGKEADILDRITARLQELGGMTPAISKAIGWEDRTITVHEMNSEPEKPAEVECPYCDGQGVYFHGLPEETLCDYCKGYAYLPAPTAKGVETYEEYRGFYEGFPCTCKQECGYACKGGCGCEACVRAYGDQLGELGCE